MEQVTQVMEQVMETSQIQERTQIQKCVILYVLKASGDDVLNAKKQGRPIMRLSHSAFKDRDLLFSPDGEFDGLCSFQSLRAMYAKKYPSIATHKELLAVFEGCTCDPERDYVNKQMSSYEMSTRRELLRVLEQQKKGMRQ